MSSSSEKPESKRWPSYMDSVKQYLAANTHDDHQSGPQKRPTEDSEGDSDSWEGLGEAKRRRVAPNAMGRPEMLYQNPSPREYPKRSLVAACILNGLHVLGVALAYHYLTTHPEVRESAIGKLKHTLSCVWDRYQEFRMQKYHFITNI